MLSRDGVIARYIFAFCFFLCGSQMVTGWSSAVCAILGCVELATALLRYSPLYEIIDIYKEALSDIAKGRWDNKRYIDKLRYLVPDGFTVLPDQVNL